MDVRFPPHEDSRYFTLDGYIAVIERAVSLGYRPVSFRTFPGNAAGPVLLLRHDLDHSLKGIDEFAEREAQAGGTSTYFIQTACEYYNVLARPSRALVRRLVALGHEVGLHYESDRYTGPKGARALLDDLRLLEDLSGEPVVSAAQHLLSDQDPVDVLEHVENEAYEPRFTDAPMTYISDSLMTWRQATPHDLLDEGLSFQFLSHPETWLDGFENMASALSAVRDAELEAVRKRYDSLKDYYAELLANRAENDRRFREKRGMGPA